MVAETLLRLAAKIPGVASDLADWYEHAHRVAKDAQREHRGHLARDPDDPRDPSRWVLTPRGRRAIQKGQHHDEK